ncbi:PO21 protein, partial [Calyptomena viridis]|nr:PO21 protein [Calyptomena viridis]
SHDGSHQHILMDLKQKGEDLNLITFIKNMYENICTYIDTKNEQLYHIQIQTGVKEDDPMLPLLFNLAVDPVLCKLEECECGKGYQEGENTVTAMAFADHLILFTGS